MEEVYQFTLNSSILSGMFEDLNMYAFSKRLGQSGRVGNLRFLFANNTLVKKSIPSSEPRM